jgi:hypothetical protein
MFRTIIVLPALLVSRVAIAADAAELWSHETRRPYAVERFAPPPPEARLAGEVCRVIIKRRIDEFGELAVRRVRICEEEPRLYAPRRDWSGHPVPPRNVGRPVPPAIDFDGEEEPG